MKEFREKFHLWDIKAGMANALFNELMEEAQDLDIPEINNIMTDLNYSTLRTFELKVKLKNLLRRI